MTYTLRLFFLFLFTSSSSFIYGANYYWVGGSGNWSQYSTHWATSSGGSSFHPQVPTNLDNVYFDQNSGFTSASKTVTVNQTIVYCKDMDWTGAVNNPSFVTTSNINTLKVFGSLTLITAMNFNYTADISFEANSPGNTISSNNKTFNCRAVYFNGTGGGWSLSDSLTVVNIVTHNAGTLTTNNQILTTGGYLSTSPGVARALNLGSSIFKIKTAIPIGLFEYNFNINPTNFTLNAGTSVIQFVGNLAGGFSTQGLIFNDLVSSPAADLTMDINSSIHFRKISLRGNSILIGGDYPAVAPDIDSLVLYPGKKFLLNRYIKISTSGALVADGTCSKPINIESAFPGEIYFFVKAGDPVNVTYVTIQDAGTTGGAQFNATNSYDMGNVSGWNISSPSGTNLYWVGGSGVWSDPSHWASTSGGPGNNPCIPFIDDNVFFDANSGFTPGSIVTLDLQLTFCKDIDWTGAQNTPTLTGPSVNELFIAGSLTFIQNMVYTFPGDVTFNATQTGKVITSANKVFTSANLKFNGVSGGWMLADSLSGSITTILHIIAGELNTNNKNINIGIVSTDVNTSGNYSIKAFTLGTSRITVTGEDHAWEFVNAHNLTLSATSSTIVFTNLNTKLFASKPFAYNNVICARGDIAVFGYGSSFHKIVFSGAGSIGGSNSYDSLVFAKGKEYKFESGSTQTILNGTLVADGNCSLPISIQSENAGQAFTFVKSSGSVDVNYVLLKDNIATGGALFTAQNSHASPEVTGWVVNYAASNNLYWIGGSGNWGDSNHWSFSSGGTGGACIPGPWDNVYFDVNSFPTSGASVTTGSGNNYCKDMNWTGSLRNPVFNHSSTINTYGNITLISAMSINGQGLFNFNATTTADVNLAGHLIGPAVFTSTGTYNLRGTFNCKNFIVKSGTIYTNNYNITSSLYFLMNSFAYPPSPREVHLGSSTVTVYNLFEGTPENLIFDAGTSTIVFNSTGSLAKINSYPIGFNFYNVISQGATKTLELNGKHFFNKLTLMGPADFNRQCTFDTLKLTPGRSYNFHADSTQTINKIFDATGTPGFPIELLSTITGRQATIKKTSGVLCLDYLYVKDIRTTGGAQFFAGANSSDVANNSGWLFTDCLTTGTTSASSSTLSLYPIPVNGILNINRSSGGQAQLYIINTVGAKVLETSIADQYAELDLSALMPGIYTVVITEDDVVTNRKITVY